MTLDLSADMALMDGLAIVSLVPRGEISGASVNAIRRDISTREAAASNGRYLSSDVRFHWQVDVNDPETVPQVGDTIEDDDGSWTILEVRKQTLNTRWACVCRNLAIQSGLDTVVKIQTATWSKDANGAQVASWADTYTNVPARIQRVSADESQEKQHHRTKATYEVYTTSTVIPGKNHRIVGADSAIYRITGYRSPDRIDQLPVFLCEDWMQ